ncbi:hypothetical protein GMOD_00001615 [Pyrenophora seminiperda CCB06]|uniref:Uncharacterized protein n=1 Tax=Pyrenophora seminiperda CCB06 TaxID=1302712 RepID=A0A3M7LZM0_9PLEO|nr:hypothetical protein GMOD_00001615 [Pyrenophora seminiperda CCB06]
MNWHCIMSQEAMNMVVQVSSAFTLGPAGGLQDRRVCHTATYKDRALVPTPSIRTRDFAKNAWSRGSVHASLTKCQVAAMLAPKNG